ncbi:MAG: helix-turn-helix domain-containing protein [Holosporales bacterium]|jgi:transcriptional regulator with XRE-family HTH domain|nr:helix-turn-helix domain-containing protein [Holosporales bacterium]
MSQNDESLNSVSIRIGAFIRFRRQQLGMTQRDLAHTLNITPQQVQKYEAGINALRITRLIQFSKALKCPLENFLLIFSKINKPMTNNLLCDNESTFEWMFDKQESVLSEEYICEIEIFLAQFLSLRTEMQKNIMQLVNALSCKCDDKNTPHVS